MLMLTTISKSSFLAPIKPRSEKPSSVEIQNMLITCKSPDGLMPTWISILYGGEVDWKLPGLTLLQPFEWE